MANTKAILTEQQVKALEPFEEKLSKFTLKPRNVGYCDGVMKEVLQQIYKEVTGTKGACSTCNPTWICKMNEWYKASKEKYSAQPTKRGRKPKNND